MTSEHEPQQATADTTDLTWWVNGLARQSGVLHVVLATVDGMLNAWSSGLAEEEAAPIAAAVCGYLSLAHGQRTFAGLPPGSEPSMFIVDWDGACVLIMAAGRGTVVTVSVAAGMLSPEMAVASAQTVRAVRSLQDVLSVRPRTADTPS